MLDVIAYCDESATEHQVYCVAGYCASPEEWERLGAACQTHLDAFGIAEVHAQDCEHGHGEFAGRDDRPEIFEAFIALISRFDVHAVFAVVDLRGWDDMADAVAELRARTGMGDPYYIAFQQLVETIALGMAQLPEEVHLSLLFDDRPKQGNVVDLYESLKTNTNPALAFFTARLGSVTKGTSDEHVGLQAADLFAHEVRKQISRTARRVREPEPDRYTLPRRFGHSSRA